MTLCQGELELIDGHDDRGLKWYVMKLFSMSLFLLAAQISTENGNLIAEPTLADYSQGDRTPGIMGVPQDIQDADGNPSSL